ncbi:MAG: HlyD family efflux transporter periplasmic adaptor subunit [Chloroflexi bacterium]|nr:HlyD family efflux transporter periplasmic adaptor subunit [Chloroflexota bacterium]
MKKLLVLIIVVAAVAGGYYWYVTYYPTTQAVSVSIAEDIRASGLIEAKTLLITSETGGRIIDVFAREGDEIATGDLLIQLDDSMLKAQQAELEAAINTARANLNAVSAPPRTADIAVAEAALIAAKALESGAYQVWQQMLRVSEDPQELLIPIQDIQAQIQQVDKLIEMAKVELKSAGIQEENAARDQSAAGKVAYQIALKQGQAADVGVRLAKANRQALRTQLKHLREQYNNPVALQTQAHQAESAYSSAEAAVAVAEAQLAVAKTRPRPEDIAVAAAQVRVAESARALFDTQMSRLTLTAPDDGLITTRTAERGKMAIPGAILFSLADLDRVTLRVYIPQTQIGKVSLGQSAQVTIDSVDRPFAGTVSYIAAEAEFTPQNVQIPEERVNLVFAVEISLDNPNHILKPGMPADAELLP